MASKMAAGEQGTALFNTQQHQLSSSPSRSADVLTICSAGGGYFGLGCGGPAGRGPVLHQTEDT